MTNDALIIGSSYFDLKDDEYNEDITMVDLNNGEWTFYPKGQYQVTDSRYRSTHWGNKDYLVFFLKRIEIKMRRVFFKVTQIIKKK